MITRWTVQNFKSIREPASIEFGPLTLLCGPNSAGKSSILQSMLVLSQSTSARLQPQALQLNGRLVQLGTIYDVLHRPGGASFSIAADFDLGLEPRYEFVGRAGRLLRARLETDLIPARPDSAIEPGYPQIDAVSLTAMAPDIGEAKFEARRRRGGKVPAGAMSAGPAEGTLANDQYRITLTDTSEEIADRALNPQPHAAPAGVELQGPVPTGYWRSYNPVARRVQRALRSLLLGPMRAGAATLEVAPPFFDAAAARGIIEPAKTTPRTTAELTEFVRSITPTERRLLRTFVADYTRQMARSDASVAFEQLPLPPLMSSAANGILQSLSQIRHVGPLREAPRALYALPVSADPLEVGSRGEFTAAVLHRFRGRPVRFHWGSTEVEEPLGVAVNRWLTHLGVHHGAQTEDYGRLGHVLSVTDSDVPGYLDLTQVGVGVSQLLPVVVQALLTPAGGTVMLEQPELHLHPGVQAGLADFLWAVAKSDRLVVCETHSEYLVNRIRIRIASHHFMEGDVAVYFIARETGVSVFDRVELDRKGRIRNWPKGFFDQSAIDAAKLVDLQLAD